MVNLPEAPQRIVTTDTPRSSLSAADIASPYVALERTMNLAADRTNEAAKEQALKSGIEAVDDQGNITQPTVPIIGDAAEIHAKAARVTALNKRIPEIEDTLTQMRLDHQNNPAGFKTASDEFRKRYVSNITDPLMRAPLDKAITDTAGANFRATLHQADRQNVQDLVTTSQARLTEINDRSAALARQGLTETPQYAQLMADRAAIYRTLARDPRTGFTAERAEQEIKANRDHDVTQMLIGKAVNGAESETDVRKTLEKQFWGEGSEALKLSPQQRDAAISHGVAAYRNKNAEDSAEVQAVRTAVDAYVTNLRQSPGSFNDIAHNAMVAQATELNDRRSLAALSAMKTFTPMLQAISALPPAERQAAIADMSRGLVPATGPIDRRLSQSESSGDPKRVNQLGYAGLWQFGAPRLTELGVYTPGASEDLRGWSKAAANAPGKWSGTFSVPGFPQVKTLQDFLASPDAQKAAYEAHKQRMDREITSLGLDQFEGKTVGGVKINRDALYGMIHLGGAQGTFDALHSGGVNAPKDANGTSVMDYARKFGGGDLQPGTAVTNPYVQKLFYSTVAAMREQSAAQADKMADKLATDLIDRSAKGQQPYPGQVEEFVSSATSAGRGDLIDKVKPALVAFDTAQGVMNEGGAQAAAVAAQARAAAAGGAGLVERQVLNNIDTYVRQSQERMAKDPIGEASRSGWVAPVGPIAASDPKLAAQEFADRNRKAEIIRQRSPNIGPVKIIGDDEAAGFRTALTQGEPAAAAGLLYGLSAALSPENYAATLAQKDIAAAVTGMMSSRDPVRMGAAMAAADKLWQASPSAAKEALGADAITKLQAWQGLKDTFSPAELAERLNMADDPSTAKARELAQEQAAKETDKLTPADMAYKLGSSFGIPVLSSLANPITGATPAVPYDSIKGGALVADYKAAYTALRAYGVEPDRASELAVKRLQSTWGVSQAAGNQVMQNPPEKYYPKIDGSHDWMEGDLKKWITSKRGEEFTRSPGRYGNFSSASPQWTIAGLISDKRTQAEISAGRAPSYVVVTRRSDGNFDVIEDRVTFDPSDRKAAEAVRGEQRRQERARFDSLDSVITNPLRF